MGPRHISHPSLAFCLLVLCCQWPGSQTQAQGARQEGPGEDPQERSVEKLEDTLFAEMLRIVDQKFDSLSARISSLERSVNSLNFYAVRQFREVTEHLQLSTAATENLGNHISKLGKEERVLRAAVSQATRDINAIKADVRVIGSDVSAVSSDVTVTKSNVEALKSDSLKMFEDIANSIVYINENVEEKTEEVKGVVKEMAITHSQSVAQSWQRDIARVLGHLQDQQPSQPSNCNVNFGPLEERIDLRFAEMKRQTDIHFVDLINAGREEGEEDGQEEESPPPTPRQQTVPEDRRAEEGVRRRDGEKVMNLLANMTQNVMEAVAYFRHTGGILERLLHSTQTMAEEQTRLRYDVLEASGMLSAHTGGAELLSQDLAGGVVGDPALSHRPALSALGSARPVGMEVEEEEAESNVLKQSGDEHRQASGFSRSREGSQPYVLKGQADPVSGESVDQTRGVTDESLRVLEELTRNGSQVLDVMTDLAQLSSTSVTQALEALHEEVEKLRQMSLQWREKEVSGGEQSNALPPSAAQDRMQEGDLASLHNTTKTIFSIVEAIASNTGWIPYIFHTTQHVERMANRTLQLAKRSLLTLRWNRSYGNEVPVPLAEESRQLVQGSLTQVEALDVIYETSMKMGRILPALTRLLADQEPLIALAGGRNSGEGRVEVFYRGQWGSTCRRSMGHEEASQVCQHLGFKGGVWAGPHRFGRGVQRYWHLNVSCVNDPVCSFLEKANKSVDCPTGHFAVVCDHMLRLTLVPGSSDVRSGLVWLHHQGVWLPVCSHGWSGYEARVACKQLGFLDGRELVQPDTDWSQALGKARLWASGISCSGEEVALEACKVNTYAATSCAGSGNPAAVRCQ